MIDNFIKESYKIGETIIEYIQLGKNLMYHVKGRWSLEMQIMVTTAYLNIM